jgi:signal transduction histidine kinase
VLRLQASSCQRHGVTVVREFLAAPPIHVDSHKVIEILVNLLQNAVEACDAVPPDHRNVTVRVAPNGAGRVRIEVADTGIGIPPENLTRIFSHGFTTRDHRHGLGLHSGALAAKELGGSLTAASDGPGRGATFALELPVEGKAATAESPHAAGSSRIGERVEV